jgi:uncharacterized repeat protein (TIGR01451 family)
MQAAKLGRQARLVVLVAAFAACGVAGLFASQLAFGQSRDDSCNSDWCTQVGNQGNATVWWVKNEASPGGPAITSREIAAPAGTQIYGTAGDDGCQANGSNVVMCTDAVAAGQAQSVDLLAQGGPLALGTQMTATVTIAGTSTSLTVPVESAPITSSTGSTSTTPVSPPPPPGKKCKPKLHVTKTLTVRFDPREFTKEAELLRHEGGPEGGIYVTWLFSGPHFQPVAVLHYEITVTNTGNCDAKDVFLKDRLPENFLCSPPSHVVVTPADGKLSSRPCKSGGTKVVGEELGDIPPGRSAKVEILGEPSSSGEGKVFRNTAVADSANAGTARNAPPVAMKVVTHQEFEKTP